MAIQDAGFYQYLKAAFRYRLYDPKGKLATSETKFSYLSYNFTFDRIFFYARRVLPSFYRNQTQFPNTEEGNLKLAQTVLQKLERHQDTELERYFNPDTAPKENELVISQAQEESQQNQAVPAAQVPAGATATGPGNFTPNIPRAPVIHNIPKVNPPTETLKTNVPEAFEKAFENEPEYKTGPTKRPLQKSSPRFQPPKVPSSFINSSKNFGSAASRFFQRNVGKFLTLERGVTAFTTVLGGIVGRALGGNPGMFAGAVTGAFTPTAIRAGAGQALGRFANRVADVGVRFSNEVSTGVFRIKSPPKKVWFLLLGMFMLLVFTSGFAHPINTGQPGGPTAGGTTGELNCTTSMTAQNINDYFSKNGYDYFLNTGDRFVNLASQYNINPAVIIAIGMIESDLGRDYPVGSPGYNKFDAFGISPDGSNVIAFSSWMDSAEASFKAVSSYKCAVLECIAGRPQTYNSADPNWTSKLKSALSRIPHSSCGSFGGPVAGAPGIPSGWPATGIVWQVPYQPGTTHANANAVDIANNTDNTPIYATLDGKVSIPEDNPLGYGHYVKITNENTNNQAIYAHLKSYSVVGGQMVQKGDQLGIMDSTGHSSGPHVHYELVGPLGSRSTLLDNYVPQADLPLKPEKTQVQAGSF